MYCCCTANTAHAPPAASNLLLCYFVGLTVVAVGSVVGGLVALLMKWLSAGVSLGALVATWVVLLDGGRLISSEAAVLCTFGAAMGVCIAMAWHLQEVSGALNEGVTARTDAHAVGDTAPPLCAAACATESWQWRVCKCVDAHPCAI
jgi:hypothetical protein